MTSNRSADVAEAELDRFINSRYRERISKTGARREIAEFVMRSRDREAQRREENRIGWIEFHRGRASFHYQQARVHIEQARQYEHLVVDGTGDTPSHNGHGDEREE